MFAIVIVINWSLINVIGWANGAAGEELPEPAFCRFWQRK